MGQLTNQFVSQSYQGLLNLANTNTGFTTNLQTITDGLGGSSPLQISQTQVNISGAFTVNGLPIQSVDTGSLVTTSSFNAYTSSVNIKLAGLDVETGSLQSQINQKLNTSSFNAYTSSNDSKVNSLISQTGSYVTETESGSFMITGSVAGDTLTFTKGNGSQFSLQVNTGSLPSGVISGSQQIVDLGFATTSSLDTLSGSIATTDLGQDNRLSSIEGKTGSYATTGSNDFVGQQNINGSVNITGSLNVTGEITALSASITYLETIYQTSSVIFSSGSNILGDEAGDTQTLYGTVRLPNGPLVVTGSVTSTGGFTGSLQGTASYATNALSSSHAINADTASFVNSAVTSSIAFDLVVLGKCDNPGGLTRGTIVRITGAVGDNPLFNSASWEDDFNSANTLGMLSENVAYNGFANVVVQGTLIGINTSGMTAGDMLYLSSSGQYTTSSVPAPYHEVRLGQVLRPQLNNGSAYISIDNGYELTELHDVDITSPVVGDLLVYRSGSYGQWVNEDGGQLGFAITGSNNFIGTENITGSLNVSGSANFVGDVSLNLIKPNDFKQNLVLLGANNATTSSTNLQNYLNAITTSLDNDDVNFGFIPGGALLGPTGISNVTSSIFISGSNNFLMNLGTTLPASSGRRSVIGGNANFVQTNIPTINTSSLTIPQTNNNYLGAALSLTLTTGSNLGNGAHAFNSNILLGGGINFNHPSASIGAGQSSVVQSNISVGTVQSLASGSLLTTQANFSNNINVNPQLNLRHISGSIQATNNIFGGNIIDINNRYINTGSNNSLIVSANTLLGQGLTINAAGSPATNVARPLVGNLIGGQSIGVSLEQTGTDLAGLRNSIVYGYGLTITGSHSVGNLTQQGSSIFGRWNGEDNGLNDSARTVFAIGTGTGGSNRRTSLYVTSGSLVGVSGSLNVSRGTNVFTVTGSATIEHVTAGQPALTLIAQSISQPALTVSGSLNVSGSGDHYINGNSTNITSQFSVNGNTNVTGSLSVSGSSADHSIIGARLFLTASLNASSSFDHNIVGSQINITGNTSMYGNGDFPLTVYGTINSKRLHFNSNPFNSNPSSNLAALRLDGTNQTFYSTNYDLAQITTQSQVYQTVITGSNLVETGLQSNNMGSDYSLKLINQSGTGSLHTNANVTVTGSLTVNGSTVITGSVQGNVLPLTVTSNTASLNLNNGNFFELALTGSSDIRIEPSNIKPGQTINIKLNTTGSGTVSFPTSVKQPSGSAYIPTTTVGTDILTMVSFDTTNLYVANVKNLI